jgi:hypothetical protein
MTRVQTGDPTTWPAISLFFVNLQCDSVFRLTRIGGKNSARLPIVPRHNSVRL